VNFMPVEGAKMADPYDADHIVIGLDIKGYSLRDISRQMAAQEVLDRCLQEAFPDPGLHGSTVIWIDGGDGGYVLLEGSPQSALAGIQKFYERLAWANRNGRQDDPVYVRAAIHVDKLLRWQSTRFGARYTGNAINDCSRLLNGMNKNQVGQVVCSGEFLRKLNSIKLDVVHERLRDIMDKHGKAHTVFNIYRTPGFGVVAAKEDRHPDVTEWLSN